MGQSQNPLFLFLLLVLVYGVSSTTFTVVNQCSYTVWPGLLSGAGTAPLPTTGFSLNPTETRVIPIPAAWSGRIWGRTLCTQDATTGKFTCVTGDCGSSAVECSGSGAAPPATLAEFTLNGAGGLDFYDVSLVDGYNIPMAIVPQGGGDASGVAGNCTITGCVKELNGPCPAQLKVATTGTADGVACKSACEAFGTPEYCCSGAFATPDTCKPSEYSLFFKNACPRAYSYAYDDGTSTFTCAGADYLITFCPSPNPRPLPFLSQLKTFAKVNKENSRDLQSCNAPERWRSSRRNGLVSPAAPSMFSPINHFQLSLSTLLPSPATVSAPRYQIIPLGTDLNWLLLLTDFQESFYTWPP